MLVGLVIPSQLPPFQPPMVYVHERQKWEYHVVVRNPSEGELLSQRELNELGTNGWELTGVITLSDKVHFYFKRVVVSTRSR